MLKILSMTIFKLLIEQILIEFLFHASTEDALVNKNQQPFWKVHFGG